MPTVQDQINEIVKGNIIVTASAGTGKTTCLVRTVKNLIEKGIDPTNILVFTFTVTAAQELKDRLGCSSLTVGTIHSVLLSIIRNARPEDLPEIVEPLKQYSIFNEAAKNAKLDPINIDPYKGYIGFMKNMGNYSPDVFRNVPKRGLLEFAKQYELIKERDNYMDFDDILLYAVDVLRDKPTVKHHYQDRWKYIFVDESQDLCPVQIQAIELLADSGNNLFMVGDIKQTIYGFRASNDDFMANFARNYDAKQFQLPKTYRCKKRICDVGNNIARLIDETVTIDAENGDGAVYNMGVFPTQFAESQIVADSIQERLKEFPLERIKVLYRLNSQSLAFQSHLLTRNIPFKVTGNVNLFTKKEIKIVLSWVKLTMGIRQMKRDEIIQHLMNIKDTVGGYVGFMYFKYLKDHPNIEPLSLVGADSHSRVIKSIKSTMEDLSKFDTPSRIIEYLVSTNDYFEYMEADLLFNIQGVKEFLSGCTTLKEMDDLIARITCIRNVQDAMVELSTIHKAKGLESDTVYVTGVADGLLPHDKGEPCEELNLFYVAVTRARNTLFLSGCGRFGEKIYNSNDYLKFINSSPKELMPYREDKQEFFISQVGLPIEVQAKIIKRQYAWNDPAKTRKRIEDAIGSKNEPEEDIGAFDFIFNDLNKGL